MSYIFKNLSREKFSVTSHRPDEAIRWMRSVNGPHSLELRNPSSLNFSHKGAKAGKIATGIIEYSTPARVKIDGLIENYIINIPLFGEQVIDLKNESFESNVSVGAIISPNQSLTMSMAENCRKHMVSISRDKIESKVSSLLRREISSPVIFEPKFILSGYMQQWWEIITSMQQMMEIDNPLFDIPEVWSNLEEMLITGLVYSQKHNYYDELLDKYEGRPYYLTQLESLLRNSLNQPIRLADLERASGVSRDRLYKDFKIHYGMSPVAYFRQLRLDYVHQRLTQARPSESVSSIAMDCGFQQLGRFSQEYKVRFGELPSKTLNRTLNNAHMGFRLH